MRLLSLLFLLCFMMSCNTQSTETTHSSDDNKEQNVQESNANSAEDKQSETNSDQKEVLEDYLALEYPLEIKFPEGYDEILATLKNNQLELLSMGNPDAKKGMLVTEDGTRLSVEAAETRMGNISLTFSVVDAQAVQQGNSSEIFISGHDLTDNDIIRSKTRLKIKDGEVKIVQMFTKTDNTTITETSKLVISPEGILE